MKIIAPGLYTFTGLIMGRVYLIEDPDGLTLVDTGLPLAADRIVKQLTEAGHQPTDVRRILITHAHSDHIGGLPKLKEQTGAAVLASALERPVLEGTQPVVRPARSEVPLPWRWLTPGGESYNSEAVPVDRVVEEGEVLPVMGKLHVIAAPGHSPGQIAFWQPERRILLAGDAMATLRGRLGLPFPMFTADMEEAKRTIQKLAALDPAILGVGHGPPLIENTAEKLRTFAQQVQPGG